MAAPHNPRHTPVAAAGVAALIVVAIAIAVVAAPEGPGPLIEPLPREGRSPAAPAAGAERVLVRLPRPSVGELALRDGPLTPDRQREYAASLRAEGRSLRSALDARGVRTTEVQEFALTFNGFAATVPARDLASLGSLGVRASPVRRFYPAADGETPLDDALPRQQPVMPGTRPVALLDSGVDATAGPLRGRVEAGYDVIDGGRSTEPGRDPRDPRRREGHGTEVAGVLALAGIPVVPIRVSGLQLDPATGGSDEFARSDQLIAGLERAVDPDGDGSAADALSVALVGVAAPFDGFEAAPEATAAAAAGGLGTLVLAPAGNDGAAAGVYGTIAGPGAGAAPVAVGALEGGDQPGLPSIALVPEGSGSAVPATLLGGPLPTRSLVAAAPVDASRASLFDRGGRSRVEGRLAIVQRGERPAAQAAAAAAAGAGAVLLLDADAGTPLPATSGGRTGVPVLGVSGADADAALLSLGTGTRVRFGTPGVSPQGGTRAVSPTSARGPAFEGAVKPDLVAAGAALTVRPGGATAVVTGTSIAAARAAVIAARLATARPRLPAPARAARLTAAAAPLGGVRDAGAGVLDDAGRDGLYALPRSVGLPAAPAAPGWRLTRRIVVHNDSPRAVNVTLAAGSQPGAEATVAPAQLALPAGGSSAVTLTVAGGRSPRGAPTIAGRVVGLVGDQPALSVPWIVPIGRPEPPPLAAPELLRRRGQVNGVRFAAGAFRRGTPAGGDATLMRPVERVVLELIGDDGRPVEELTPSGGARDLLPGVYAYTLPRSAVRDLDGDRRYRFRVRAWSPLGGPPAERRSELFSGG